MFRVIVVSRFGIQSHYSFSYLAVRAIVHFPFWCSEPRPHFDVQSHFSFFVWRSEPSFVSYLAFRATFSFWHSEPLFIFCLAFEAIVHFPFGIQSHIFILVFRATISFLASAFRAIITHLFWRSEPSPLLCFDVQSHHYFQYRGSEP